MVEVDTVVSRTQVVVVGAGPAGLAVANVLRQRGVDCVVLEERSREFIENRPRAGFLEEWAVRRLDGYGLAGRLLREGVLQQSALSDVDAFCAPERTTALTDAVLAAIAECEDLADRGVPVEEIEGRDFSSLLRAKERPAGPGRPGGG